MKELQSLLSSGKPLFITIDGFRQAMLTAFPLNGKTPEKPEVKSAFGMTKEDRKSTRLNSSHIQKSRMPSSA